MKTKQIVGLSDNEEKKHRLLLIMDALIKVYPEPRIQLVFSNEFELLVATILSAQCTDARVNIVTKKLFVKYKSIKDYIDAKPEELEQDIFSTGFYKAKARHIQETAVAIIEKFNGRVPSTMEELLSLPGVGRKTANVILGHCFSVPAIVVDTHVIRIARLLGLTESKNPDRIERDLMELLPKNQWVDFTHYMIMHGRKTCIARKPHCSECVLQNFCDFRINNQ